MKKRKTEQDYSANSDGYTVRREGNHTFIYKNGKLIEAKPIPNSITVFEAINRKGVPEVTTKT